MINRQLVQKMILHHTSNVMKMGKQEVHIKSDYKENADVKSLIDNKLKGFNQDIIHSMLQSDNEGVTDLASYIFQLEGKLLRPKFGMLLGYGLIPMEERGREEEILDKIKTWSAVIEMIHNSSLLQDDIIDNASVRRNRPTAHTIHGDTKTTILPLFIVGRAYV